MAENSPRRMPLGLALALPLYAVVGLAPVSVEAEPLLAILSAGFGYLLMFWVYYATARMALDGESRWAFGSLIVALVAAYGLFGLSSFWLALTSIGMLFVAGTVIGRATRMGRHPSRVYIFGLIAVTVFNVLQFGPLWGDLMTGARETLPTMMDTAKDWWRTMGVGEEAITDWALTTERVMDMIIRISPALMLLSALVPFSMAFLIFAYFVQRRRPESSFVTTFTTWKMPFALIPVLVGAVLLRLTGVELLTLIGDNVVMVLAMFYCVAGLALVGFFLRRLQLPIWMKVFFYFLLFLSQMVGIMAAALLGFVDSFFDWRHRLALSEAAGSDD